MVLGGEACLSAVVPLWREPQVGGLKGGQRCQRSCRVLPGSVSGLQDLRSGSHPLLERQLGKSAAPLRLQVGRKDDEHAVPLQVCRSPSEGSVPHIYLWPAENWASAQMDTDFSHTCGIPKQFSSAVALDSRSIKAN